MDWPRGRAPHRSDSFESYEASESDEESEVHHSLGKVFPEKPSLSSPTSLFSANNSGTSHRSGRLRYPAQQSLSRSLRAVSDAMDPPARRRMVDPHAPTSAFIKFHST